MLKIIFILVYNMYSAQSYCISERGRMLFMDKTHSHLK